VFRVAVLSFWHIHAKDYALQAEEHPGTEITAVWDENGERGQAEAAERGVPFHDDLEGLLSREDVDGVIVTTPTVAHREVIPASVIRSGLPPPPSRPGLRTAIRSEHLERRLLSYSRPAPGRPG
jgi:predicted dehydrogenase